jgi:serine/threonine-protein kinase SRK2
MLPAAQVFLTDEYLVLVMEYAAGGDLFKLVAAKQGLPEDDARWFFQQFILAIDYSHRMVRGAV